MRAILGLMLLPLSGVAQILTGTITGTVQDPTQAPIPDATVVLRQPATGLQRRIETSTTGDFSFNALGNGTYEIAVTKTGFRRAEKRDLVLDAGGRLSAGTITMELGAVTDTITGTGKDDGEIVTLAASDSVNSITYTSACRTRRNCLGFPVVTAFSRIFNRLQE